MTTPAAERQYLLEHLAALRDRGYAVFNPLDKPVEDLPVIYGFNNGGSPGWYSAVALSEDGVCLGGHLCAHEACMESDLGILEGSRPDRHENEYKPHYPDGYRMEFVPSSEIDAHAGLQNALKTANDKETEEAL